MNTTNTETQQPSGVLELSQQSLEQPEIKTDWQDLYIQSKAENERLSKVIEAGRLGPVTDHPQKNAKPGVTAERLKAMLGPVKFLQATRSEKLTGLGLNPAEVDDEFLRRCFGRSNDGVASKELMRVSPLRYRQLREAALVLNIFGA